MRRQGRLSGCEEGRGAPLGWVRKGAVPVPPGARLAVIFFIWYSLSAYKRQVGEDELSSVGSNALLVDVVLDSLRILHRVALDVAHSAQAGASARVVEDISRHAWLAHPLLLPFTLCSANETSRTVTPSTPASCVNSTTSLSLVYCGACDVSRATTILSIRQDLPSACLRERQRCWRGCRSRRQRLRPLNRLPRRFPRFLRSHKRVRMTVQHGMRGRGAGQ